MRALLARFTVAQLAAGEAPRVEVVAAEKDCFAYKVGLIVPDNGAFADTDLSLISIPGPILDDLIGREPRLARDIDQLAERRRLAIIGELQRNAEVGALQ